MGRIAVPKPPVKRVVVRKRRVSSSSSSSSSGSGASTGRGLGSSASYQQGGGVEKLVFPLDGGGERGEPLSLRDLEEFEAAPLLP